MKSEILAACDRLVAATLNGGYQGLLIALLVGLCLRLLGRTNAATRHAVWLATLVLLAALIPAHLWCAHLARTSPSSPVAALSSSVPAPGAEPLAPGGMPGSAAEGGKDSRASAVKQAYAPGEENGAEDTRGASPLPPEQVADAPALEPPLSLAGPDPAASAAQASGRHRFSFKVPRVVWNVADISKFPKASSLIIVALWLVAVGIRTGFLVSRLGEVRGLKCRSLRAAGELSERFERLRRAMGLGRKVELRVAEACQSPVVLGFRRAVILLPPRDAQGPDLQALEAILRHELAHVRRYDDWANLMQNVIQAGLFFHPAVWWISKRLSIEREIACDDYVLEEGARRQPYALLLAKLAERMQGPPSVFAPGASGSKSQLQQRITMILNTHRNSSPRLAKTRLGFMTTAAALTAVVAIYSAPRLVLAQPTTAPAGSTPEPAAAWPAGPGAVAAADPSPDLAQPAPPGAGVAAGPKFKPGEDSPDAPPVPAAAPVPPYHPAAPAAPRPPWANNRDSSLEERIGRLEQLMQALMRQQHNRQAQVGPPPWAEEQMMNPEEIEATQERARRQAKRAMEQAELAARHAEEMAAKAQAERQELDAFQEGFPQQLEALRRHRESLEREMQKLDRQIERIEQDQKRLREQRLRSELDRGHPQEEAPAAAGAK